MKTTIDIPDAELRDVVRNTGAATKREAVVTAIADYNRRRRLAAVVKEFGTMKQFMTRDELQRLRRGR
jgi:type II secretory pathway predicted ATPase ExeA